ncbi:MAG: class I SAM-dependent methyltransferase, partial [Flavobacteriales bacterium]
MPTELIINRVPESTNNSLRAWSAADELLVSFMEEKNPESVIIYNDAFGYLAAHSAPRTIYFASDLKSQEKAALENFATNKIDAVCLHPTSLLKKADKKGKLGLMKIPKSMGLFEMFLSHSAQNMYKTGTLACGFMTRNFTKQILEIAGEYFEEVEQSLSKKKARLLILSKPKNVDKKAFLNTISFNNEETKQYFGVFSSKHIDYATQFLIENLEPPEQVETVLDLASGNGILAKEVHKQFPDAEYHLIDDSQLAVESSKLNLEGEKIHFYHNNNLEDIASNSMDYIVSNPPFHVEFEIDISLPLRLFRAAEKKLKPEGK